MSKSLIVNADILLYQATIHIDTGLIFLNLLLQIIRNSSLPFSLTPKAAFVLQIAFLILVFMLFSSKDCILPPQIYFWCYKHQLLVISLFSVTCNFWLIVDTMHWVKGTAVNRPLVFYLAWSKDVITVCYKYQKVKFPLAALFLSPLFYFGSP